MKLSQEQRTRLVALIKQQNGGKLSEAERSEMAALSSLASISGELAAIEAEADGPEGSGDSGEGEKETKPTAAPAAKPKATGLLSALEGLAPIPGLMAENRELKKKAGSLTAELATVKADLAKITAERDQLRLDLAAATEKAKSIGAAVTDELAQLSVEPKNLPAASGSSEKTVGQMTEAEFEASLAGMTMSQRIVAVRQREQERKNSRKG